MTTPIAAQAMYELQAILEWFSELHLRYRNHFTLAALDPPSVLAFVKVRAVELLGASSTLFVFAFLSILTTVRLRNLCGRPFLNRFWRFSWSLFVSNIAVACP